MKTLEQKKILITGASKRIGREFAIAAAHKGAFIYLHYSSSEMDAQKTQQDIDKFGGGCELIQADFSVPQQAIIVFEKLFAAQEIYAVINNASIFLQNTLRDTTIHDWDLHQAVNLTMPFLLTQAYANSQRNTSGKIINILDWRALRPGKDHFAYTISKAGLAALTKASALSLAPTFQVNGLALGAILPPTDGGDTAAIIKQVPAGRWVKLDELIQTFLFLLTAPQYITGEIIHVDGGRHLV
jgi:NAD(P)-dependent dehydrogenase (short-subunit alcohol dehydrogenase family)